MVTELKRVREVHAFLIVFNGQAPFFNESVKTTIQMFIKIFGNNFLCNTAFVFTKWTQTKKEKRVRERQGVTEEALAKEFNDHLKEFDFDSSKNPVRCFFIDNSLHHPDNYNESEEQEKVHFTDTIH